MKKQLLNFVSFTFLFASFSSWAQTTIYSTDFGNTTTLPAGWAIDNDGSTGNHEISVSSADASPGGGDNMLFETDNHLEDIDQYLTLSGIDTRGYTNIKINWRAKLDDGANTFPSISVEYSTDDGGSWTAVQSYTDVSDGAGWGTVSSTDVDASNEAEGDSDVRFRFRYTSNSFFSATYRIDDFEVTGTCSEPTTASSASSATTITSTGATVSWTNGNGNNRILVMSTAAITGTPSDNTTYSADATYNNGQSTLNASEYVMYNSTGSSVAVAGLTMNTTYHYAIFEYNCTPGAENYFTTSETGSFTTCNGSEPTTQASASNTANIGTTTVDFTWTSGNGDERIVIMKSGSAVDVSPTDNNIYAATANFTTGEDLGTSNIAVFSGASNSFTATNLTANTTYHYAIYEYNCTGTPNYLGTPETGSFTTCDGSEPTTQASASNTNNIGTTTADFTWTSGNGLERIVVLKSGSAVDVSPTDNSSYTPNANFTTGEDLGSSNIAVYGSAGNSFSVTNLTANTTYHYAIYEYNCQGSPNYLGTPETGSFTTCDGSEPTTQASASNVSNVGSTTADFTWTSGNGLERIVVLKSGSAVDVSPTDNSSYTPSANFTTGEDLGSSNIAVYGSNGNSFSVTNLTANTTYHYAIYEYNCQGSPNYLGTPETGSFITCDGSEPTTDASADVISAIQTTGATLNWTNGNGSNRLVVLTTAGSVTTDPVDASVYTADANFSGTPQDIGTNEFAMYNGTGTSVTFSGLSAGTTYAYKIFEFNCEGSPNYYTTGTPESGSFTTCAAPSTQVTAADDDNNTTSTSFDLSWTTGDGSNAIVVVRSGAAVNVSPTSGTTYTANANFGSGTDLGSGNFVVYNGTSTSVTVANLSANTTYHWAIYEFNDCSSDPQYLLSSPQIGDESTSNIYYSKSGTGLQTESNWNTARDGSGSDLSVGGFATANNTEFRVEDVITGTAGSIGGAWVISGTNSKVIIETGASLKIPAGLNSLTGTIEAEGTGELQIDNATNPTFGTLSSTSTVVFGGASTTIPVVSYGNVTIDTVASIAGNVTVTSNLTINNEPQTMAADLTVGGELTLNDILDVNGNTLTLNGTSNAASTSTITGSTSSNLVIGGTGSFGTLFLTLGTDFSNVTINRTGASNSVTLGNSFEIDPATSGSLTLTDGELILNDFTINFRNQSSISCISGSITGSSSSRIQFIGGSGAIGSMAVTQTSDATRTFNRIANTRSNETLTLDDNIIISDRITIGASAIIDLDGNNLELNNGEFFSTGTIATKGANITISGTTNSAGTLNLDQTTDGTTNAIGTLIMNRDGQTLTLGNKAVISTACTISDGTIDIDSQTMDGTGATLTVSSGATLKIGGTNGFPTFATKTIDRASTIEYDGAAQSIAAEAYGNLTLTDDGGSATKSLAAAGGSLAGELSIGANVTFDFSNNAFTFNSDATGTAALLEVPASASFTNASAVTVQRYVTGDAGWRIFAAPGTGSTLADWNNEMAMSGFTGSNDPSFSFVSTYFYDETVNAGDANNGYTAPTNTTDALVHYDDRAGVFTYLSDNTLGTTPLPLTADVTVDLTSAGTKTINNMSLTGAAGTETGWHAVGNPYPSGLRWAEVIANGMTAIGNSGAIYTMDANQNFNASTTVTLASCEGGFIQVTSGTNTITIQENDKATTGTADTYNDRLSSTNTIEELALRINVDSHTDWAAIKLNENATNNYDSEFDARKLDNFAGRTNISILAEDGENLQWNSVNDNNIVEIPIRVYRASWAITGANRTYELELNNISDLVENNRCLVFEDRETGISFPLMNDTSYSFTMSDTTSVPRLFITVNRPINETTTNVSCFNANDGSIIALTNGVSNYEWKDQAGNIILTNDTTGELNNIGPGIYHLSATGYIDGCPSVRKTIEIIEPTEIITSASSTAVTCNGGSDANGTISAIGGAGSSFTYNWDNGITDANNPNLIAGIYNVTVMDNTGCTKTESIVITEPSPTIITEIMEDATCYSTATGSIDLTVNGPSSNYTYEWSNGETTEDLANLITGTYGVVVTDANGCNNSELFFINEPAEIIADFEVVNDSVLLNSGGIATFTNYTTGTSEYLWNFGDGTTSTDDSPWHVYSQTGTYDITLVAGSGSCTDQSTGTIVVYSVSSLSDLTNESIVYQTVDNKLIANFNYNISDNLAITIYNSVGQIVEQTTVKSKSNSISIDLPNTTGVYIIEINDGDNRFVKKHITSK